MVNKDEYHRSSLYKLIVKMHSGSMIFVSFIVALVK